MKCVCQVETIPDRAAVTPTGPTGPGVTRKDLISKKEDVQINAQDLY